MSIYKIVFLSCIQITTKIIFKRFFKVEINFEIKIEIESYILSEVKNQPRSGLQPST